MQQQSTRMFERVLTKHEATLYATHDKPIPKDIAHNRYTIIKQQNPTTESTYKSRDKQYYRPRHKISDDAENGVVTAQTKYAA